MNWKAIRVLSLMAVVSAGLIAVFFVGRPFTHKVVVKAYFSDGMDLREGAPVRMAGVDIGHVRTVRVRPELRESPVEITMVLAPSYQIQIPNDSVATLSTAGLLGATYVTLDISSAIGPPVQSGAVIKTKASTQLSTGELLKRIDEMLQRKVCDLQQLKDALPANGGKPAASSPPK